MAVSSVSPDGLCCVGDEHDRVSPLEVDVQAEMSHPPEDGSRETEKIEMRDQSGLGRRKGKRTKRQTVEWTFMALPGRVTVAAGNPKLCVYVDSKYICVSPKACAATPSLVCHNTVSMAAHSSERRLGLPTSIGPSL